MVCGHPRELNVTNVGCSPLLSFLPTSSTRNTAGWEDGASLVSGHSWPNKRSQQSSHARGMISWKSDDVWCREIYGVAELFSKARFLSVTGGDIPAEAAGHIAAVRSRARPPAQLVVQRHGSEPRTPATSVLFGSRADPALTSHEVRPDLTSRARIRTPQLAGNRVGAHAVPLP